MTPRVALVTYSMKPRGGVVHTLELAEALVAWGADVTVVALGEPGAGFFRPVAAPVRIIPAPPWGDTLEERVFRWIDAMTGGLDAVAGDFDIVHTQDCISARAAARVRAAGARLRVVRTVHHVDDFTTPALVDCQRQAILEPDTVLVVSEFWRRRLCDEFGVDARVVTNGVRADRYAAPPTPSDRAALRARIGRGRPLPLPDRGWDRATQGHGAPRAGAGRPEDLPGRPRRWWRWSAATPSRTTTPTATACWP